VKKIFYSSYLGFKLLLSLEAFKKKTELDPLQYQLISFYEICMMLAGHIAALQ